VRELHNKNESLHFELVALREEVSEKRSHSTHHQKEVEAVMEVAAFPFPWPTPPAVSAAILYSWRC